MVVSALASGRMQVFLSRRTRLMMEAMGKGYLAVVMELSTQASNVIWAS
jgi:hypothetical protein